MIFANPPLVELIAELRWVPASVPLPAQPQNGVNQLFQGGVAIPIPLPLPHLEESFSRFSNEAAAKGFGISERLMPVGFPYLPFTVVYRFRKPPATSEKYLYQIGAGLFSANALPPYRDWETFRPIVREGIEALLASRHPTENTPFTVAILRYIDLFSEEFTEGQQSFQFMNDVLGLKLELPNTLKQQVVDVNGVRSGIQLSMPLADGLAMNINLQDGVAGGKPGILMSTEVLTTQPTAPEISLVMGTLERAHDSIRATFLGLTEKLRAKMRPAE
jgi:uncharacterized protein (TIGR04255 family)